MRIEVRRFVMRNGMAIKAKTCASACKRRRRALKIVCVSGAKLPALSSTRRARHLPSPVRGDTKLGVIMLNFEKLEVWKRGCRLSVEVYRVLANVHDYGLVDQMTRAAVSIPSNIAEGAERRTDKEYINFLHIAKGSVAELRTQLYIASKLDMIPKEKAKVLIQEAKEISAMLQAMIGSIALSEHSKVSAAQPPRQGPRASLC